MASRFWVGGTGTWDATSTTHWSASSGGGSGASVPGVGDDVQFDSASGTSGAVVTLNVAPHVKSLSLKSDSTGPMLGTFAQGTRVIAIEESFRTSTAANFHHTFGIGARIDFVGTTDNGGDGWPLTTGGALTGPDLPEVRINGVGGKWTLAGAMNLKTTSFFRLMAGAFNTDSFPFGIGAMSIEGAGAKELELDASEVVVHDGSWDVSGTNFTIFAGTSHITVSDDRSDFNGGGKTYHDVSLTGSQVQQLTGRNHFTGDLERIGTAGSFSEELAVYASQIVDGTFRIQGASPASLVLCHGQPLGYAPVIEAGSTDFVNAQLQDVIGSGGAAPFSGGTYVGDGQGCLQFAGDDARQLYWVGGSGDWSDSGNWSLSSGGAGGEDPPLAQDDAFLDDAGLSAGDVIYVDSFHLCHDLDMTAVSVPFTMQLPPPERAIYGDVRLSPFVTLEPIGPAPYVSLRGRGQTYDIESNGVEWPQPLHIRAPGCDGYRLVDAFVGVDLIVDSGSIDWNGQSVVFTGLFEFDDLDNAFATRLVNGGAADVELQGVGAVWDVVDADFVDMHLATVRVTDQSDAQKAFRGGDWRYGRLGLEHDGELFVVGANTFDEVTGEVEVGGGGGETDFRVVEDGSASDDAWAGDLLKSGTYKAAWEVAVLPSSLDVYAAESDTDDPMDTWGSRTRLSVATAIDPWLADIDGDVYCGWQSGPTVGASGFSWVRRVAEGSWTTPALAFEEQSLPIPHIILEGTVTKVGGQWIMVYDRKPTSDTRWLWGIAIRTITTNGSGSLVFGALTDVVDQSSGDGPGMGKAGNQTRATVADSGDGGLLIVWSKDVGDGLATTLSRSLYGSRSGDGGATWSAPFLVATSPGHDLVNPFLVLMPDGTTVRCYFWSGAASPLYFTETDDGGATWSTPTIKTMPQFVQSVRPVFRWNDDQSILYCLANAENQTKVGVWIAEP